MSNGKRFVTHHSLLITHHFFYEMNSWLPNQYLSAAGPVITVTAAFDRESVEAVMCAGEATRQTEFRERYRCIQKTPLLP